MQLAKDQRERDGAGSDVDVAALHRDYARFVAGFVQRLGVAPSEVADLVQDVFLRAHAKGGYRAGAASPRTWLANLALGEVRNLARKRSRRAQVTTLDSRAIERAPARAEDDHLDAQLDRRRRLALVQRALDSLDEDSRVVFMLFELEGERCAAIAAGLGIPLGTVHSRLHGARRKFASAIERLDPPHHQEQRAHA